MSRWVNTAHEPESGPYYIRGVKFVDGVAEADVSHETAEFFRATGIHEKPQDDLTSPKSAPNASRVSRKPAETQEKTKTPTDKK